MRASHRSFQTLPTLRCRERTHYNYFRDYDPTIGRYVQSDPIGLVGGFNTYSYSDASPLLAFDFFALAPNEIDIPERPRGPVVIPDPSRDAQRGLAQRLQRLFCDPDCWDLVTDVEVAAAEVRRR